MKRSRYITAGIAMIFLLIFIIVFIYLFTLKSKTLTITIVHTNDLHAQFSEVDVQGGICKIKKRCFGGFSRLNTAWQQVKKGQNLLTFDAGDIMAGSIVNIMSNWSDLRGIHKINYDAIVLGDSDIKELLKMEWKERETAFYSPVVVTNIEVYSNSTLAKKHLIIERGGVRIGVLGIINKFFGMYVTMEAITIEDEIQAIVRETKVLRTKNVFTVIVLSHCGYHFDEDLAVKVPKEVSLIIGGHSHTILYHQNKYQKNEAKPFLVTDTYPKVKTSHTGHKVLVVTAGFYGMFIGNLTITYDKNGVITNYSGNAIFIDKKFENDPQIDTELAPLLERVQKLKARVLGHLHESLTCMFCRYTECTFGNIFTQGLFEMVTNMNDTKCVPEIMMSPSLQFKANILRGEITEADIYDSIIDHGVLMCLELDGGKILDAITQSFKPPADKVFPKHVMQVTGLRVVKNYRDDSVEVYFNHRPIDINRKYKVLANSYLYSGGDGFRMLNTAKVIGTYKKEMELFIEWILLKKHIYPSVDGRIKIIEDPHLEDIVNIEQQLQILNGDEYKD